MSGTEEHDGATHVTWSHGMHVAPGAEMNAIAYDRYLGRWSRMFVPSLLEASRVRVGHRVLDVATGPGDLAMEADAVVGRTGLVVATDIAEAMAETASRRSAGRLPLVIADGEALPFRDATFDAVVCQLGIMFFDSPQRALAEFRRVLHPSGRVAVSVISARERAPMWGILAEVLSEYLPAQRKTLNLSFSLADAEALTTHFIAAGLREVEVRREVREGAIDSLQDYWDPIDAGVGQLPVAYRALPRPIRRRVHNEVNSRLAPFLVDGRLQMTLELLIATARP